MSKFNPRTTRPEKNNKYYIRQVSGGWNGAVQGKPKDKYCDVLSNCVGYANGRFNEICGKNKCMYQLVCNAENFVERAESYGLKTSSKPQVGAIMCWKKGSTLGGNDGAGHVAIVEKVISDTEVITSESGYGCTTPFWNQNRKIGTGNWGMSSPYKFRCFILNPTPLDVESTTEVPTKTESINKAKKDGKIAEDGIWGKETTIALQKLFKVTVTGVVKEQTSPCKPYLISIQKSYWKFTTKSKSPGDLMIRNLQRILGVPTDGLVGYATISALQNALKKQKYYTGIVNGKLSKETVRAFQKWINKKLNNRRTKK